MIDQFLRDSSNLRTDEYGGSVANRVRFLEAVTRAVTSAWANHRTGVRLSPTMNGNGMSDIDPIGLYSHVAKILSGFHLVYVHTAESIRPGRLYNPDVPRVTPHIRANYDGTLITNGGYDKTTAADAIRTGAADAVAFGQFFIANPDLPERFRIDAQLNRPVPETFYGPADSGYVDYPFFSQT